MLGTESYSGNLDWELKSRAIDVSKKKYGARNFCFPLLPVSLSHSHTILLRLLLRPESQSSSSASASVGE